MEITPVAREARTNQQARPRRGEHFFRLGSRPPPTRAANCFPRHCDARGCAARAASCGLVQSCVMTSIKASGWLTSTTSPDLCRWTISGGPPRSATITGTPEACFQHHVAEGIGGGGKHHGIGAGVGRGQFFALQEPGEDDGAARALRLQLGAVRPVADQNQAYQFARLKQTVQGVDQQVHVSSCATSGPRRGT